MLNALISIGIYVGLVSMLALVLGAASAARFDRDLPDDEL